MVGNSTSVTGAQAGTPASTTAEAAAVRAVAGSGKEVAKAGQSLPAKRATPPVTDISAAVQRLNELMAERQRTLEFHVDDASGRTVITVREATTSEIVRQIPSQHALALAEALEHDRGLLDSLA